MEHYIRKLILYGSDLFETETININLHTLPYDTIFIFLIPEPKHISKKPDHIIRFGLDSRSNA